MKEVSRLASRMSPSIIFLILICSIIVSEVLIVLFIGIFPPLPQWGVLLLNAILPSVLIVPFIYFYIFRPLTNYITECNRIEEALRESEDRFCNMAEQMSVIAEIGRVIGSTLEIDEVYERFAAEARKLIPFDRIDVSLCNIRKNIVTIAYVSGAGLSNYKQGDSFPLTGTLVEEVLQKRTGLIIQSEKIDEVANRIPALSRTFKAGLRSIIGIPLIYKDDAIGILQFRSKTPDAYTDQDLRLAERIGTQIAGAIANAKLLSDLKRSVESLLKSEDKFKTIYDTASDGILIADPTTKKFLQANNAICSMLGYTKEELESLTIYDLHPPKDISHVIDEFEKLAVKEDSALVKDLPVIRKDGSIFYADLGSSSAIIGGMHYLIGIFHDITERKQAEEKLRESENKYRELSIVDDLTQLYNSRHFYHQLKREIDRLDRYEQPLVLLLLDLDDFRQFNDIYGPIEGDQVLLRLAQVVRRCLRQTDSAYRYGGDEFTILLPMTTSANATVTAERIRTEFKKETFSPTPAQDVHMTVSIGHAQYKHQEDMKVFVQRVDQLLYQAKNNGKDRVCSESSFQS